MLANRFILILLSVLFWVTWVVFMFRDPDLISILLGILLVVLLIIQYRYILPYIDLSWTNLSKEEAVKRFVLGTFIVSTIVIGLVYLLIKTGII